MHKILVTIHVWSSALFTIVALVLCLLALKGYFFNKEYKKNNIYLEYSYIALLYLGFILGVVLYFFIDPNEDLTMLPIEELIKKQNSQFWAIEHFSVMLFTLMIAQIGRYFASKAITDKDKFKYVLFYYGSATSIIYISMCFYLYYKFF